MTEIKTVQTLAQELYDAFETKKRDNGNAFVVLKDGSPKWMTEVSHKVHGDKLPDDTTYEFIERAAGAISDVDEIEDAIAEMEPDVYTNALTGWLHARADHIYYLNEALEQYGPFDDGFKLLATAQQLHIQEVARALVAALEEIVEEQEEE
jgi:hypothetical protein